MERKTKLALRILISKHIKKCAKDLNKMHKLEVNFAFRWFGGNTIVDFGDEEYLIDGEYNIETFSELVNESLKETLCDGILVKMCNMCKVILYGKPLRSFDMLQRLIKRYTNVEIDKNTIKTEYTTTGGVIDITKTKYLCYDDDFCKDTINWIRTNKTGRDILKCNLIMNIENPPSIVSGIKLYVETYHGKFKGERKIAIW